MDYTPPPNPEEELRRKSIRLKEYDYSQNGAYYLTMVAENRHCLFGEVVNNIIQLTETGKIVEQEWLRSSQIRKEIRLDYYVVMPNHFHGIVIIDKTGNRNDRKGDRQVAHSSGPRPGSIGALVGGFKASSTKAINQFRNTPGAPVWQRNYYEHIIRDEKDMNRIRDYIVNNPFEWMIDGENPNRKVIVSESGRPAGRPYG